MQFLEEHRSNVPLGGAQLVARAPGSVLAEATLVETARSRVRVEHEGSERTDDTWSADLLANLSAAAVHRRQGAQSFRHARTRCRCCARQPARVRLAAREHHVGRVGGRDAHRRAVVDDHDLVRIERLCADTRERLLEVIGRTRPVRDDQESRRSRAGPRARAMPRTTRTSPISSISLLLARFPPSTAPVVPRARLLTNRATDEPGVGAHPGRLVGAQRSKREARRPHDVRSAAARRCHAWRSGSVATLRDVRRAP